MERGSQSSGEASRATRGRVRARFKHLCTFYFWSESFSKDLKNVLFVLFPCFGYFTDKNSFFIVKIRLKYGNKSMRHS